MDRPDRHQCRSRADDVVRRIGRGDSMSKHTPGPWFVGKENHKRQSVEIDSRSRDPELGHQTWVGLAKAYGCEDMPQEGFDKAKANARLIAAAPEILEALQLMIETHENGGWPSATLVVARSAIAKATGESA